MYKFTKEKSFLKKVVCIKICLFSDGSTLATQAVAFVSSNVIVPLSIK